MRDVIIIMYKCNAVMLFYISFQKKFHTLLADRQAGAQVRTFFEVPCRNLPLTNPNLCNAFLCKHKSALRILCLFGPSAQKGMDGKK